jgi:hypothetical protein
MGAPPLVRTSRPAAGGPVGVAFFFFTTTGAWKPSGSRKVPLKAAPQCSTPPGSSQHTVPPSLLRPCLRLGAANGIYPFVDAQQNKDRNLQREDGSGRPSQEAGDRHACDYGGLIGPAMQIGELIRQRGMATFVPGERTCASACALIWVAGFPRFVGDTPQIGFHAAYDQDTGQAAGAGNAILGAYLRGLGFGYRAFTS